MADPSRDLLKFAVVERHKATGDVVWETELPSATTSGPMTYLHQGRQYVVVAVGARNHPGEWVALALP